MIPRLSESHSEFMERCEASGYAPDVCKRLIKDFRSGLEQFSSKAKDTQKEVSEIMLRMAQGKWKL